MPTVAEIQSHILQKVENDLEFRERLIADPKGVIEAETGQPLPDDILVFVQEAIGNAQKEVSPVDAPLTQDELTQVMGGSGCPYEGSGWAGLCLAHSLHDPS